jgi:hypothetical protein
MRKDIAALAVTEPYRPPVNWLRSLDGRPFHIN